MTQKKKLPRRFLVGGIDVALTYEVDCHRLGAAASAGAPILRLYLYGWRPEGTPPSEDLLDELVLPGHDWTHKQVEAVLTKLAGTYQHARAAGREGALADMRALLKIPADSELREEVRDLAGKVRELSDELARMRVKHG